MINIILGGPKIESKSGIWELVLTSCKICIPFWYWFRTYKSSIPVFLISQTHWNTVMCKTWHINQIRVIYRSDTEVHGILWHGITLKVTRKFNLVSHPLKTPCPLYRLYNCTYLWHKLAGFTRGEIVTFERWCSGWLVSHTQERNSHCRWWYYTSIPYGILKRLNSVRYGCCWNQFVRTSQQYELTSIGVPFSLDLLLIWSQTQTENWRTTSLDLHHRTLVIGNTLASNHTRFNKSYNHHDNWWPWWAKLWLIK